MKEFCKTKVLTAFPGNRLWLQKHISLRFAYAKAASSLTNLVNLSRINFSSVTSSKSLSLFEAETPNPLNNVKLFIVLLLLFYVHTQDGDFIFNESERKFQLWGHSQSMEVKKKGKKVFRERTKFFLCDFFVLISFHLAAFISDLLFEHQNPSVLLNHQNRFQLACFCLSCERLFQDIDGGGQRRRIMANDARFISAHVSSGWYCEHLCTHIKLSTGMSTKKSPFVRFASSVLHRRRLNRCNYCERIKFSFLSFNYSRLFCLSILCSCEYMLR